MEELLEGNTMEIKQKKRPVFLLVLCILSFVSIGSSLLSAIISLISGPMSDEALQEIKVLYTQQMTEMRNLGVDWAITLLQKLIRMTETINENHYVFYTSNILILFIGAFGVFSMLKGRKIGFHLYIIYSLLTLSQLYFFVSPSYVPTAVVITGGLFSGLFIFMYSRNLKWMK